MMIGLRLFYNGAFSIASKNDLDDQNLLLATVPSITIKKIICLTLSEFENFLLCERTLINVITCQN
jgi:hypothetical protein